MAWRSALRAHTSLDPRERFEGSRLQEAPDRENGLHAQVDEAQAQQGPEDGRARLESLALVAAEATPPLYSVARRHGPWLVGREFRRRRRKQGR